MNAGQRVTVTFGTNPSAWDPADPPDYLDFYLGVGTSAWLDGAQPVDVALYDGDRLLGSRSGIGRWRGVPGGRLGGPARLGDLA